MSSVKSTALTGDTSAGISKRKEIINEEETVAQLVQAVMNCIISKKIAESWFLANRRFLRRQYWR